MKRSGRSLAMLLLAGCAGGAGASAGAPEVAATVSAAPEEEAAPLPASCVWRESEYFDETTVTTCNAYSTISVRFLSMGPGGCAVEARASSGERRAVTALPAVWTGWVGLVEHTGVATRTIRNTVHCDTGVRSQVRYSAPR